jgi:membrane-associated phospholipid phosphatase
VLPQIRHWILWPAALMLIVLAGGVAMTTVHALTAADLSIDQALSRGHSGALTAVAFFLGDVFSPIGGVILLSLLCLAVLLVRRNLVDAVAVGMVTTVGWLSSEPVKTLVGRARPDLLALDHPLVVERGADSFPSAHTCLAVSLSIALYFLSRGTRWQRLALSGGIVLSLAVAASRVYLGAHYPTDVAASYLVSVAAILFFSGVWNRFAPRFLGRFTPRTGASESAGSAESAGS